MGQAVAPVSPSHSKLDTSCFSPIFQLISPPEYKAVNNWALPAARITWQAGKRWDAVPRHVPRAMLCAAALGVWAAGSAGAPAPSLRTPPLACSPKDHTQTQIARLHPPPPIKSIIRCCSPA